MRDKQTNIIRNSWNLYKVQNVSYYYNKFDSTENIIKTIFKTSNISNVFTYIRDNVERPIVYAAKKRDDKIAAEIYIYINTEKTSIDSTFLDDTMTILKIINTNVDITAVKEQLLKLLIQYKICVSSYDIDDNGRMFNNYIHLYTDKFKVFTYNLNTHEINDESIYEGFYSRELRTFLDEKLHIPYEQINKIINDLLKIHPMLEDPDSCPHIALHQKYYNNSFGIYLPIIGLDRANSFLMESFGCTLCNDDGLFNDLLFGVGINYSLDDYKINGYGFCDYF